MNIIELAKQAGMHIATDVNWMPIISLEYAEKFAELVAAAARADEREECAAMFMAVPRTGPYFARLIRARGTT